VPRSGEQSIIAGNKNGLLENKGTARKPNSIVYKDASSVKLGQSQAQENTFVQEPKISHKKFKEWIAEVGITKELLLNDLAKSYDNAPLMSFREMCQYFDCPESQNALLVFSLFETKGSKAVDVRKIILALACTLINSITDILKFEFEILDAENTGYMSDEELIIALQANHFSNSPEDMFHKAKIILSYSEKVF